VGFITLGGSLGSPSATKPIWTPVQQVGLAVLEDSFCRTGLQSWRLLLPVDAPAHNNDMLARLVVPDGSTEAAETFKRMALGSGGTVGATQARALGSRAEVTSWLDEIQMPTLVTWGEQDQDQVVPIAVGQALADALPHAHFHVPRDCGHLPTLEELAECAVLFVEFLDDRTQHLRD
jgi:pimeloyl-ACP methyl ester carboxylesterase